MKLKDIRLKEIIQLKKIDRELIYKGEPNQNHELGQIKAYQQVLVDMDTMDIETFETINNKIIIDRMSRYADDEPIVYIDEDIFNISDDAIEEGYYSVIGEILKFINPEHEYSEVPKFEIDICKKKLLKDLTLAEILYTKIHFIQEDKDIFSEDCKYINEGEISAYLNIIKDINDLTTDVFESKYLKILDMNIEKILCLNDINAPESQRIQGYNFAVIEVLVMINPKKQRQFLQYIPKSY